MAQEFGGIYDVSNMSDEELRQLVVQQLGEYPNIDSGWVTVEVKNGHVSLSGRVGTDGAVQVAEQVVNAILGIDSYTNDLIVDELHRGQAPIAADVAVSAADQFEDQLGEPEGQTTDTAGHLTEDIEAETYGTHDMQKAIREGATYIPPDRPISDGYDSRENH